MFETRKYFLTSIIIIFFITLGAIYITNIDTKNTNEPVGGIDRPYYFRIELSQWTIKLIDLNRIEDLALQGYPLKKAFSESTYIDHISGLEKGSQVFFQIYSLDVQHGISINDLDINISGLEPTYEIESTIPTFYDFYLPDYDTSFTAYCHVYCGLGHSNMKLTFDIGNGDPQYGKLLVNMFIILIAVIAAIFSYLLSSPIKRKVFLMSLSNNRDQLEVNSHLLDFNLYDISKLSEKELVALRLGSLNLARSAILLNSFKAKSKKEARKLLQSDKTLNNYVLIN